MRDELNSISMVEVSRNDMLESMHHGVAIIIDWGGMVIHEWGDTTTRIFPRSAIKMIQALPLIETGALNSFGLGEKEVALACASHQGSTLHTNLLKEWLLKIGFTERNLRCGIQPPSSSLDRKIMRDQGETPTQLNNNCSGKHTGFLTVSKFLGFPLDYTRIDHPLQKKIQDIISEMSDEEISQYGIDGCSAPNFMCSVKGLAHAMSKFSCPKNLGSTRCDAVNFIVNSMFSHPKLVAGQNRACTELMEASELPIIVKTGAEGVFMAAVPEKKVGIALKIVDGSVRASEVAITAILVRLGVVKKNHQLVRRRLFKPIFNWNGIQTGFIRPSPKFWNDGLKIL